MRFSMLYSGEQILSFKLCLVFYAGDSLKLQSGVLTRYGNKWVQTIYNCPSDFQTGV